MHALGCLGAPRRISDYSDSYVGASGATSASLCALGVFLFLLWLSCIDHSLRASGNYSNIIAQWSSHYDLADSVAELVIRFRISREGGGAKLIAPLFRENPTLQYADLGLF